MDLVSAKKTTGLGDLFKGYTPQQLEETVHHPPENQKMSSLLQRYACLFNFDEAAIKRYHLHQPGGKPGDKQVEEKLADIADILTPAEIDSMLTVTSAYETLAPYDHSSYGGVTSHFIGHLIQKSYDAGMNDFVLHTKNLPSLDYLAFGLHGESERKLKLAVYGSARNYFAQNSRHCDYHIHGDVDLSGGLIVGCTMEIEGYCRTFVDGNTDSQFTFQGGIGEFHSNPGYRRAHGITSDCTFNVKQMETYQYLRDGLRPNVRNTINLFNSQGKLMLQWRSNSME